MDDVGVDYLLGGSLASSVLGEPRSTVDIDLALALREAELPALVRALEPTFFVDAQSRAKRFAAARVSTSSTARR